jgi:hypothetical protein
MVEHNEARRRRIHFDSRHCSRPSGSCSLLISFENQGKSRLCLLDQWFSTILICNSWLKADLSLYQ